MAKESKNQKKINFPPSVISTCFSLLQSSQFLGQSPTSSTMLPSPQAAWLLNPFLHKWVSWPFGSLGCCELENHQLWLGQAKCSLCLKVSLETFLGGVEAMILGNLAT